MTQTICEELLLLSVKSSLFVDGITLNMNEINDEYVSILKEYGIDDMYCGKHNKFLKELRQEHIPNIEFVKSVRKNESETVTLSKSISQAMQLATSQNTSVDTLVSVASVLRDEIMTHRDWKFSTDLINFKNPPMLQLFLNQLLFGPHSRKVTGRRDAAVQKTVDVACQFLMQNTRTDRQVKHKPKKDAGFRYRGVETPLSIGLPLAIHSRVRDKILVNNLTTTCIGSDYRHILDIEKRVEHAVLLRMQETGGFCLPDFVKKDVNVWFAVDNIDLIEDSPYGQNTFHGTVIVLNQRENNSAEPMNTLLIIPKNVPPKSLKVNIHYLDEPIIQKKPIHFIEYKIGRRDYMLLKYQNYIHTWMVTNYLANETDKPKLDIPADADEGVSTCSESIFSSPLSTQVQVGNEELDLPVLSSTPISIESSTPHRNNVATTGRILHVASKTDTKQKLEKRDVMPTWAATKSLLLSKGVWKLNGQSERE